MRTGDTNWPRVGDRPCGSRIAGQNTGLHRAHGSRRALTGQRGRQGLSVIAVRACPECQDKGRGIVLGKGRGILQDKGRGVVQVPEAQGTFPHRHAACHWFRNSPKVARGGWACPSPTITRSGANVRKVLQCFPERGGGLSAGKVAGGFLGKRPVTVAKETTALSGPQPWDM